MQLISCVRCLENGLLQSILHVFIFVEPGWTLEVNSDKELPPYPSSRYLFLKFTEKKLKSVF